MKIVFVTNSCPPQICGVGDYTFYLAQELIKRGYEVNVLKLSAVAYKKINKIKPDLINIQYTHSLYKKAAMGFGIIIFAFWVRIRRIRCVTTFHERYHRLALSPNVILLSLIQRLDFFLMIMASKTIIFCSESWVKDYRRYFFWLPKKVYYLPVGSNIPYVSLAEAERHKKRFELSVKDETIILGTFNRVKTSINRFYFDTLLSCFESLKRKGYDVILLLIGWPSKKRDLYHPYKERIAQDGIKPVGSLPAKEVSEYLNLIDIYLAPFVDGLTSRKGSVMAAMHHGLPVITTFTAQTDSIFNSCNAVKLVQPDKKSFIDALINLAENRRQRALLGNAAKVFYEKNFSWDKITAEFIKIIDN